MSLHLRARKSGLIILIAARSFKLPSKNVQRFVIADRRFADILLQYPYSFRNAIAEGCSKSAVGDYKWLIEEAGGYAALLSPASTVDFGRNLATIDDMRATTPGIIACAITARFA